MNVLRQLAINHEISLVSFHQDADQPAGGELERLCRQIDVVRYRSFQPSSIRALLGLMSSEPRFIVDTRSQIMVDTIARELQRNRPDLVVASQLDMIPYALDLHGLPLVLEELELGTFLDATSSGHSLARRARALLTWLKLKMYLRRNLTRFAAVTVVSERERHNVRQLVSASRTIEVIPNAVDLADYAGDFGCARPGTMIFSGALTYSPNFDAAKHLVKDILPTVRLAVPDVEIRMTGGQAGIDPTTLPRDTGVTYTGYLEDIRPAVAQSWVAVVPLRQGGGTRLKILEAMALGTPVVSTSKGAEGLDVRNGENILLGDDPQTFADRVVELMRSPELRERLALGGRRLVESTYNWTTVGRDLRELLERVPVSGAHSARVGS